MIIVIIILIFLSAVCNAAMDRMEGWAFNESIFSKWKASFWNHEAAAQAKNKTIGGWKFDGWHLAKSMCLIFLFSAMSIGIFYHPFIPFIPKTWAQIPAWIVLFGLVWNITHPMFYGKIFKR